MVSVCLLPANGSATYDNCTAGAIRLPGGVGNQEGRVEFCFNHVWGSVCQSDFTVDHADLVCNQLGHQPFGMDRNYYGIKTSSTVFISMCNNMLSC